MNRKQFTFFASYLDAVEDLPVEQRGIFFDAVIMYSLRDIDPEFDHDNIVAKAVFTAIKPVLDQSKFRAKAGQKGGASKAKPKQTGSKKKAKPKQTGSYRKGKERKGVEGSGVGKDKTKAIRPDNFTEQEFDDLLSHRKAMKAPLTKLALAGLVSQFEKSGLPVAECIEKMANRGWRGFEAEWVKKNDKPNGDKKTFAQIRSENNKQACREFAEDS